MYNTLVAKPPNRDGEIETRLHDYRLRILTDPLMGSEGAPLNYPREVIANIPTMTRSRQAFKEILFETFVPYFP